jgi:hypothetical protein
MLAYQKSSLDTSKYEPEHFERKTQTVKLTDHYIGLLVLIFTNAGLLDVRYLFPHVLISSDILFVGTHLNAGRVDYGQ